MRITVLGATGMVGTAIVNEALSRGHEVTAVFWRRCHRAGAYPTSCLPDVTDVEGAVGLLKDSDAAVAALRPPAGHENDLVQLTTAVLDAASRNRTSLLIAGGTTSLSSSTDLSTLATDDPAVVPPAWGGVAQANLDQSQVCQAYNRKGRIHLSPPVIFVPGDVIGFYYRGTTTFLRDTRGQFRIDPEDLALAVVDELEHLGDEQHIIVVAAEAGDSDPRQQGHA